MKIALGTGFLLASAIFGQCTNGNLPITNQTLASGTYAATGTITADSAGGTTTVPSGASVVFQAGTSIVLLPNFHAAPGSSFTTSLASCTPPTLTSVGVSPATVSSGTNATLTVNLNSPAPYGGASVALSASPSSAFPVPSNLTVLAGQTSASTQVTAGSVSSATNVTVTGTYSGTQYAYLTVDPSGSGNPTTPLQLPTTLKGLTYFPRGHAWWSMLYDWYTQDCTTSTLLEYGYVCEEQYQNGQELYVYQVVQNDLATLAQNGFNYIHIYIWDQDIAQDARAGTSTSAPFNTFSPLVQSDTQAPGFVGWDDGGPQSSPANPNGPNDSNHNQWTALSEFVAMAEADNMSVVVHFATDRADKEIAEYGESYSTVGAEYGSWVSQFVSYLAPYANVIVYGLNWGDQTPVPGFQFCNGTYSNDSWGQFWQTAYTNSILPTLQQTSYPTGRANAMVEALFGQCNNNDVPARLSGYQWNWPAVQAGVASWHSIGIYPDLYTLYPYSASTGDLQANLQCLAGINNPTMCPTATFVATIPLSQMLIPEMTTSSSFDSPETGDSTPSGSPNDAATPGSTSTGQAQWLTNTLCTLRNVVGSNGVTRFAWHGLYDSVSWWEFYDFNYSGSTLAWNGYFGLSSEYPGAGNKASWNAMLGWPGNCPASGSTATPVLAINADASYYTVNDTGKLTWGAGDVTSLSLNETPEPIEPEGYFSYSGYSSDVLPVTALTGSWAYANVQMTGTTNQLTIKGTNTDVDGETGNPSNISSASIGVQVGQSPLVTGIVDYDNTSQQCDLQQNPSCVITASQADILEIYGEGFNPTGGNKVQLTGPGPAVTLWANDGSYFWDGSRTLIDAQLTCSVTPGTWTFNVLSPNAGSTASTSYSINVVSSSSCQ